jgi:hypothetical protein
MLCTLAIGAVPVSANGPPIHDFFDPEGFAFAPGEVCVAFGVTIEVIKGRGHDRITETDDGTLIISTTGHLIARVINDSTGAWVRRNFSGPVLNVFHPDGTGTSWNRGHTLAWLIPEEGGPALWRHSGTIRWSIDENGLFSIVRETGIREDLCAVLS